MALERFLEKPLTFQLVFDRTANRHWCDWMSILRRLRELWEKEPGKLTTVTSGEGVPH